MAAAMAVQTANVFISGVTAREVNRANQAMVWRNCEFAFLKLGQLFHQIRTLDPSILTILAKTS